MFLENGEETLLRYRQEGREFQLSADDETYAYLLNNPKVEIIEEIMKITRLVPEKYPYLLEIDQK